MSLALILWFQYVSVKLIIITNCMSSSHPYLLRLLAQFRLVAKWQYFEPTAAVLVFVLFFIIGRNSYESKFTHVLNTINDCENQKKRLTFVLAAHKQSLRGLAKRLTFFKVVSLVVGLVVAAYCYINKFNSFVVMVTISLLALLWAIILLRRKYLTVMMKTTEANLHKKLLSSEADAKEIIALLGEEVCKQLKVKFERELDMQWRNQELKDCGLRKCEEEKSIFKEQYQLYKDIVAQMQKMQWCDTCSQRLNTDSNDIKLHDLETRLKNYNAVSQKLSIEKKKELTNKLLEEWQLLEGKLPFMCRRGCCIRFRHSLEDIKKAYHDKLKNLKSRLSYIKS